MAVSLDNLLLVSGWSIAAAGALTLLWALLWDRARGRRRCPKCWYDMTGVPGLVCPECGRDAKHERQLFRTRRRWRWVAGAAVLCIAAFAALHVPAYRAGGIWAAVPRPVLIWMVPHVERDGAVTWPNPPGPLAVQTDARLFDSRWDLASLWWPERALLASRARRALLAQDSGDFTRQFAARALVLLREDALDLVPPERSGPVILAKCALTYARASSYRDRGMVKGSIGIRDEKLFITAFLRQSPDRKRSFRFEYLSSHPHRRNLSHRHVVWGTDDDVNIWWTIRPDDRGPQTLRLALAAATGVSGGSAHRIPSLLLDDFGGPTFARLTDVRLADTEDLEGRRCFHITGTFMNDTEHYWIDAERFLVLRVEHRGQYPSVTTYDPEINVEIDASWFHFDPERPHDSPLQDPSPP